MAFTIRPKQEFLVRPDVPKTLSRLPELAYNILWSWEPTIRALFRRLDPGLWRECGYNPVVMLGRVPQTTLKRPRPIPATSRSTPMPANASMPTCSAPAATADGKLIAYFSAEYGLTECLPIYSGGLGILSGDHLKSSSDLRHSAGRRRPAVSAGLLPPVPESRRLAAGTLSRQRFLHPARFSPALDPAGQQDQGGSATSRPARSPSRSGPSTSAASRCICSTPTSRPMPVAEDRDITAQLYGGDNDTRIRQEIVLGIGGMRALEALGLKPTVFHMNEGHSAFLALERIRLLMSKEGLTFDEALEAARANNVFTTHTPVPAGIDLFDPGPDVPLLRALLRRGGHSARPFPGARPPQSLQSRRAALHGHPGAQHVLLPQRGQPAAPAVSQEMWSDLWPQLPVGRCRSPRSPTACICRAGSTATWPSSTISTCSPTGASAGTRKRSGQQVAATSRTRNCWKCTAAASAA